MRTNAAAIGFVGAVFAALGALSTWATSAHAHISLEQGGTHKSRSGDGSLKSEPCGADGSTRGTNIYTYAPGEKITITVVETIPHPGYFRIAFDDDGDDDFEDPTSILPVDPNRGCPYQAGVTNDNCMASDFYKNDTVLMDNLDPHITSGFGTKYTWEVTLPNVQCDNCTLQVIQVMEDPPGHGPFDNVGDIYHQCIDIVLQGELQPGGSAGAPSTAGTGAGSAGEGGGGAGEGSAGLGGGVGVEAGTSGGSSAGTSGGSAGTTGTAGNLGGAGAATGEPTGSDTGSAKSDDGGSCSVATPGHQRSPTLWPLALALGLFALRVRRRRLGR